MRFVLLGAAALSLAGLLLWAFLRTNPADLARRMRMASGLAMLALGGLLLYSRQFALALPVGMAGIMMLRRHAGVRSAGPAGKRSAVTSRGLAMSLDHDTGELDGRILTGRHSDRMLSELSLTELLDLAEEFRGDAESLKLLESYLDRAHPAWRDDVQADADKRGGAAARAGGMSAKEAYEILGLEEGAGEAEVREAHRRLMKNLHPDRGGSAALAAQINEAKDRILGQHR
jgi:hypothetical protein